MKNTLREVQARREQIVQELLAIRSLECGALSEQYYTRRGAPGKAPQRQGPYYVLSRWEDGRNRSRRVKRKEVDRVRQDLAHHEQFMALCHELEELTRQLGALEREAATEKEAVKKGLKSRSKRVRKSSE